MGNICLKISSRKTRNNLKKIWSSFLRNRQKIWFFDLKKKGISSRVFLNQNLQNLKFKSGFLSKKKSDVTKLENCANLFHFIFKCAKFQKNRRASKKKKKKKKKKSSAWIHC